MTAVETAAAADVESDRVRQIDIGATRIAIEIDATTDIDRPVGGSRNRGTCASDRRRHSWLNIKLFY